MLSRQVSCKKEGPKFQKTSLIFLLMLCPHIIKQVNAQSFIKKTADFTIGASFSQLSIQTFETKRPVGIFYEHMILHGIGVQGSFAATNNYYEFGTGTLSHAILFSMKKNKNPNIGLGWICIPFFFEHTNFHFPIGKRVELIPYLSLWRVRYYWQIDTPYSKNMFSSSCAGAKLAIHVSKSWLLSSFVEGTHIYNSDRLKGWQVGLNFGYLYSKKIYRR